jgi:hypothetical protein
MYTLLQEEIMEAPVASTRIVFDVVEGLRRATPRQAERILFHADGDTDLPTLALAYVEHPSFRLWYIPLTYQPMFRQCAADIVADSKTKAGPSQHRTFAKAARYLTEDRGGYLGYVALVGPVLCALSVGCPIEGWGQSHGVGTQLMRHMQQTFARSGIFALNVTGGQEVLAKCGFTRLALPERVDNSEYDERPFMTWCMSPAQIARTMQRYQIPWDQCW